jgi:dTDP-4-dehydrorhamnose 3,5-epimerase
MGNLPEIINGGLAIDDRGALSFLNTVPFANVIRMYGVENFSTDVIRAFHGHAVEEKFVLVTSGSAIVALAKMNDDRTGMDAPKRYVLSSRKPQLLYAPAGYANGFRALEPGTKMLFFSSTTIEQAATDDYRFPYDYFGTKIWEVESR